MQHSLGNVKLNEAAAREDSGGDRMTDNIEQQSVGDKELTDDQRRYLQAIFDFFHEKAEWPKRRYLERTLIKDDLDAREIGRSLVGRISDPPYYFSWDSDSPAVLTVPDMMLCRGSDEELDAFIKTLRFCVETYIKVETDANPQVTSLDLMTHLHLSNMMAQKVGLIFQVEPIVHGGFGLDNIQWTMIITHEMIKFRNVRSLDDYLAARWKPAQPTYAFGQAIPGLAGEQARSGLDADAPPSRDVVHSAWARRGC
jgi:hypothetical protein